MRTRIDFVVIHVIAFDVRNLNALKRKLWESSVNVIRLGCIHKSANARISLRTILLILNFSLHQIFQ